MLLGLVFATVGQIELLGQPMPAKGRQILPEVGALIEGPAGYGHLSARTNLSLMDAAGPPGPNISRWTRRRRINEALEQVGLDGVGRRPVRQYSLGMRQRLGIAGALLRRPRLLILDEPTNGLDPQGIHEIRDLLLRLNSEGTTIFLSSHLLTEIEQLCDRVGIIDGGKLRWQGELTDLRRPTGRVLTRVSDPTAAVIVLNSRVVERTGDQLTVQGIEPEKLTRLLVEAGVGVLEVTPERPTLEQAVLRLTGPGSDRMGARS